MASLYLISGTSYTFNIYNDYFGHRELRIEDSAGTEITTGVSFQWEFKSGVAYSGQVDREDGKIYKQGTKKQVQQTKIIFNPDGSLDGSVVYLTGRTGDDLSQPLSINASAGSDVNPGQEKFTVLFENSTSYSGNSELISLFTNSMMPAGLIVKQS